MNSRAHWIVPGLLGLQAAFVGSTFSTETACLLMFVLCAIFVYRSTRRDDVQRRSRHRVRLRGLGKTLLYVSIFCVIAVWRFFSDYGIKSINPIAFAFDSVSHTALVAALVLWLLNPRRGHPAMLGLGLMVILLCVAAGGASHSITGQLAVALVTMIGFVFSANFILGQYQGKGGNSADSAEHVQTVPVDGSHYPAGRVGMLFSLLVLSAMLMTTSAIAHMTDYMLPGIQTTLHDQLSKSLEAIEDRTTMSGGSYVRGSRLGSIRRHMLADPQSIALRGYSTSLPGYLRGTAFDSYKDGRWWAVSNSRLAISLETKSIDSRELLPSGQGLTRLAGDASRNLRRFFMNEPDGARISSLEIHNEPLKGNIVFCPLATRWLEASANVVQVTHHNTIRNGVDVTNPYVCGVARSPKPDVLDPQRRDLMLALPGNVQIDIERLARELCASRPTASAKANAISSYFQANFQYSLDEPPPRSNVDPVVQFLRMKHPAHCEYFATATVLLLRGAGIPARYVTGYVMTESSDEGDYWVSRSRDAHAWVEAYDANTRTWFPVESTPGRRYHSMTESTEFAGLGDELEDDSTRDDDDDGLLSNFWGWLTSIRTTDPLILIFRIGQLPLVCVLVFLLIRSIRRGYESDASEEDIKSLQMLQRMDRRLKKLQLVREPHETLHQFASRIEHAVEAESINCDRHGEFIGQAATWYRQYAGARYRGQMPIPFEQAQAA